MGTSMLGPLILASEASDQTWSSRPHSWPVGIHQAPFPLSVVQDHLLPPVGKLVKHTVPGPASDLLGPRDLHL